MSMSSSTPSVATSVAASVAATPATPPRSLGTSQNASQLTNPLVWLAQLWPRHALLRAVLGLGLLLLLWQLGIAIMGQGMPIARKLAPAPALASLWDLASSPRLWQHSLASLQRVGVGLLLAVGLGLPLGLLLGRSRAFEETASGAFQLLRMVSPLSWMPIAVMLFGVGNAPIYFLLTFAALWPIALNTSAGVRSVDPQWLALGASLSATRGELLRRIILPAIAGHVLTGVRLAIGVIWIVLVPCEMLGVSSGLGYFILDTRDRMAYDELMAVVVFIGLLGWALDSTVRAVQRRWVG